MIFTREAKQIFKLLQKGGGKGLERPFIER